MNRVPVVLLAAVLGAALTSPIAAQQGRRQAPAAAQGGFTSAERDVIAAYFKNHSMDVKPLPPGIARNLERGKALPPGIAKRQLPESLIEQLPGRSGTRADLEITVFGDRIVLLEASGLVVDILEGVFGK